MLTLMKGNKVVHTAEKFSDSFLFFVFYWHRNIKSRKVATAYSLASSTSKTSIHLVKI